MIFFIFLFFLLFYYYFIRLIVIKSNRTSPQQNTLVSGIIHVAQPAQSFILSGLFKSLAQSMSNSDASLSQRH